jgi:hypothetical protein
MMTALRRLARKAGLDHSPLRRPVDRIESLLLAVLAVSCLVAAPVLAITVAHLSHQAGLRQVRAERSWHQVPATLLRDAVDAGGSSPGWNGASVPARWATPPARPHSGKVNTSPLARAGQHVLIWVDAAGRQTEAPVRSDSLDRNAFGLEVTVGCGVLLTGALIGGGVRLAARRRRMAGWERDWRAVSSRWTSSR